MASSQPFPTRRPLAALVPLALFALASPSQAQEADAEGAVVVIAASRSNVEVDKARKRWS